MAVSVKMGVDLGSFKSGIQEGQNILKGLNAEMKATEAEFKATGNAEKALEQKTKTLNSQLQVQKGIADQAQKALKAMDEAGIAPTDAAYQKMYATMMNATAGMNEAQAALNGLGASAADAASGADQLTQSVNSIGKKMSLDQVLSGINAITTGLENAEKKAISLGEEIWNNVMNSARLADDILTQATILDMTPEQYQKYKGYFDTLGEITINEWAAAKRKIEKAMTDPSSEQIDVLKALGFSSMMPGKGGGYEEVVTLTADNWEDAFWDIGEELQRRVSNGELSAEMADMYGEAIFGKKYSSLKALIKGGKDAFKAGIEDIKTTSDEALEKDAALNDQVIKLKQSFEALQMEVSSALAPALTNAAAALDGVLGTILEYLKTPGGQELLKSLGDTVASLFEDLGKVEPNSVLESLKSAFDSIKKGLEWIKTNKQTLVDALKVIGGAFAALKLGEMAGNVWKFVDGARTLMNLGGKGETPTVPPSVPPVTDMSLLEKLGSLGILGVMTLGPAFLAGGVRNLIPDELKLESDEYVKAAKYTDEDLKNVREYAQVVNEINQLVEKSTMEGSTAEMNARLEELAARRDQLAGVTETDLWRRYWENYVQNQNVKGNLFDLSVLDEMISEVEGQGGVPVEVAPEADANAAAELSEQIGTVPVAVRLTYAGGAGVNMPENFANGLPFVPYDGFLARLHKGERVMTAREVGSRSFSSNLYVENMNMGGGMDADALAAAIAGRNQRMMAGYGS